MSIERADISDLDEIFAIYQTCVKKLDAEDILQWDEHYPSLTLLQQDIETGELFKYVVDSRIAASCVLTGKQDKEYETVKWQYADSKVLVIKRLAVEPDLRNRRIATELMTFAEGYAAEDGYTTIRLECYASNQEALNFFANRGHQKAGEVFYPRRILPFKCFEKKL